MSYKIIPKVDENYILVEVQGIIDNESAIKQDLEAHALGRKLGISKYLVDLRGARNRDSINEQYDFAYKEMKDADGLDQNAQVAMVVDKHDHSHDFIETVCRNSGYNVRLFKNLEIAKAYLKEG